MIALNSPARCIALCHKTETSSVRQSPCHPALFCIGPVGGRDLVPGLVDPGIDPRLPPILVGPFLDPPETRHDGQQDESRGEGSPFPCAETLDLGDVIGRLEAVLDDNLFHALHRRRFLAG